MDQRQVRFGRITRLENEIVLSSWTIIKWHALTWYEMHVGWQIPLTCESLRSSSLFCMEQIKFTAGSPYPHACFNARASRLGPVRVSLTGWSKTLDFQQLRKAEKWASKQTDVKQKGQDTSRWSEWTCCAKMKLAINVDYTKGPYRPQTEILWGVRASWGRMWTLLMGHWPQTWF